MPDHSAFREVKSRRDTIEQPDAVGGKRRGNGPDTTTEILVHIRPEDRIVEVGPCSAAIADDLGRAGRTRYLGLADDNVLDAIRRDARTSADRFRPRSEVLDPTGISADVLILSGDAARQVWLPNEVRSVRLVLAPATSLEVRIAGRLQIMAGNLHTRGTVLLAGHRYRVYERIHIAPPRARVHLSPAVGYTGLFSRISEAGVKAVVLRWFEDLPYVEPGEDLDLLVADDEVDKLRAIISEEPGTLPIDLYSTSGLPGSDREGMACYPPALAQRILARAARHPLGAWVPARDDHLHSLAYHAVYHKGETSGLPSTGTVPDNGDKPEHDYAMILQRIAKDLDIALPESIEKLDDYLDTVGWRPPADTLRRLSTMNDWVKRRFFPSTPTTKGEPQTTVFVLRKRALEAAPLVEIEHTLDHLGFEILHYEELGPEAAAQCRAVLRGGNWGRGPYPTSGGPPASVIVALHYGPQPPGPGLRETYPHLTNVETLEVKRMLREMVERRIPPDRQFNPVHSSDNEDEAWEYVEAALPESLESLKDTVERRRAEYRTTAPVEEVLNIGRRAKVELVEADGDLAVRKTFGRGFLRHLDREKRVHAVLGDHPGIPLLLASGENWLLRPYYEDRLGYEEDLPSLVPLWILREMVGVLRALHDTGFAVIDAQPENFLMDEHGVKLIDFEFLYEFPDDPPPFHDSITWHGPPAELTIDRPVGPLSYSQTWLRWTGMPVEVLCYGTALRQRAARLHYRTSRTAHVVLRIPGRCAGFAYRRVRTLGAHAKAIYHSLIRSRAAGAFGRSIL